MSPANWISIAGIGVVIILAVLAGLGYWYLQQPTNVVNQAAVSSAMDTAMGVN